MRKSDVIPSLRRSGRIFNIITPSFRKPGLLIFGFLRKVLQGYTFLDVSYQSIYIPRKDGTKLRMCIYKPKEMHENMPIILWMHGGGYGAGLPEQDAMWYRDFLSVAPCVIVAPDYTLSIKKPYPAALDDCYLALEWVVANAATYHANINQIFVGGNSAGGGLSAAVTHKARDLGQIKIAFQMPICPMIDFRKTKTNFQNTSYVWDSKRNDRAWKLYLGELYKADVVPKYAAIALEDNYKNLPPTLTYLGSTEPFYEETRIYIEKLKASGVETHIKVFEGAYHSFDTRGPKTDIAKSARVFLKETFAYAVKHYMISTDI